MLHSRLLRYLDEVVNSGSIRQAAEKLNVASSSINRQILELEESLQAQIFERLPRGLRLTSAGEVLITHVRQTLRDHDQVQTRILELQGLSRGTIKVATMNGLASGVVSQLAVEFKKKHPGMKIIVKSLLGEAILKAVEQGDADIGLGYSMRTDPSLHIMDVFDARLGAIVASDHPLAGLPGVRLSQCCDYPIVMADQTLSIYRLMQNACIGSKVTMQAAFETNSIELMKYLAIHDRAVTFLSATDVSEEVRENRLTYVRILDRSLKSHPLTLIHRANSSLALAPALFAESIRQAVSKLFQRSSRSRADS
ncbi:LysR family transcriptional regulator [Pseudolabrys sp. FHR47]|uniref:LysR family transcriptional regulator n=1 Tax=Pseudolabrys sp. FHR47 TaxID=2562284 RepID=UPI0010BE34F0|nr:LysR substrate-binding domain-containing protein [Pseudolabrys sp. FHR47]